MTKHEHACVVFEKEGASFVIDPGAFSPDPAAIIASAQAILITHEHADHVHPSAIGAALAARPELRLYAPASVAAAFTDHASQVTSVAAGDEFSVAGFSVSVHGTAHAVIHRDIPVVPNVGYLIDNSVYHPGDAYFVPEASVSTLLLPTSGPWGSFGQAADYVRAVRPERMVQIHEMLLSEIGQQLASTFLGAEGLTGMPLTQIAAGESLAL